jgi:glucoamylase
MTRDIEKHASTKTEPSKPAPGKPGQDPRWTTGAKTAVGTAVSTQSRVWFTISQGVLNEIYSPTIDQANLRIARFIVVGDPKFFSDEQFDAVHSTSHLHPAVPAFRIFTRCNRGSYELEKEIIADPHRDAVLMRVEFKPKKRNLRLYLVADPHLGDAGSHNDGWVGSYKEVPMLFACRGNSALAIASSIGYEEMSCGFIGESDGCTDLRAHNRMTWHYTEAADGNIGLCGGFGQAAKRQSFVLAFALGNHPAAAAQQARAGLLQNFDSLRSEYIDAWKQNQRLYIDLKGPSRNGSDLYRVSTAVLQTHESKRFPGATVASLSIPWGFDRGDNDIGGYHVIWPRDMVQAALGKLACGDAVSARRAWFFLECTQEGPGNWSQNMWLDGTANANGIQMDATAHPILLADMLRRAGELDDRPSVWNAIEKAAGYLVRNGPVTQQERWEESAGYSPNTMAIEIAALLAAADFAAGKRKARMAAFLRETADAWNEAVDELLYASGTELARNKAVSGYYIRLSPPDTIWTGLTTGTKIRIANLPEHRAEKRAVDIVSPDALGLVRYGLRSATDPRIVATVKVIDASLRTEISNGPVWHRYTDDCYGEYPDGAPFKKGGQGRGWPLLAGERAHYEIARGNFAEARRLANVIAAQTSECGLIPEQVWDAPDIPLRGLFNGKPTGSGMPLVWAHAEFIKVLRSLSEKKVWDLPPQPVQRYQRRKIASSFQIWTITQQRGYLKAGKNLRLDLPAPAIVYWTADTGRSVSLKQRKTTDSGLGVHYVLLNTSQLEPGRKIRFTFLWTRDRRREGQDYQITVR